MIKTIPQELPWLNCRHIDLTFGEVEKNGDYILQELQVYSKEREIAYRNGQRFVTRLQKVDLSKEPKHPIPFQQGGTYLVSGGLGGVGVEIAKYLLQHYQARLLLIGTTPLPEKSTWNLHLEEKDAISQRIKTYQKLQQIEGEVIYEAVDICDLNNLQAIVEKAKNKWGKNLDGIIHLAGTFHEQFVLAETQENLAAVLRPKMLGTWTLHQLIKDNKESFFINFSSINGFLGGMSVGAYAAANSFLDRFSHYQKYQSALQSYCFAWSMWDEIGMSKGYQMKNLTRAKGFYTIPPSQGISAMLASLHHDQTHLFIGLDGSNANIRRWQVESESLQKLTAYFTANSPVVIDADFQVKDDFGTVCTCKLVLVSEIPLTENGAIDRGKLLLRVIRQETGALTAPRNEVEEKIAQIWRQVLNIPFLSIEDNFFELGGHSLIATQVISRIRETYGIEISLRDLFQAPTIAQFSQLIEINNSQLSSASSLIQPIERTENLPLSFAQSRLWFIDQYEGANGIYNISQGLRLEGKLNIEALEKAVNALIVRHETLRTCFSSSEGDSVQIILPELTLAVGVTDLGELSLEEQNLEVQHLITQESHKPFDLKNPPLLRVSLFRLGETTHMLVLTIHHIIADGWSMGVLNRELSHLYRAACKEETPSLPVLPIQYADFAQWQRNWLQGEVLESQLSYWKQQLGGSLPVLELPTDHPRPAIQTYNGASISLELSQDLTKAIKALSQQEEVTLFMTLLAAFQILLHRYSGQEDVIVGTPIANRNRQEVEPLIGFFVNSLALRTNLGGNPSFQELLKRVRKVTLGAYTHQDLPFEKLVEELQVNRDLSRAPLFQVRFNMLNLEENSLVLSGLKVEPILIPEVNSLSDLTIYAQEKNHDIELKLVYNTDLFAPARMREMLYQFEVLLTQIVAEPQKSIHSFSLITANSQALLPNPSQTIPQREYQPITNIFTDWATQTPKQPAIIQNEQIWTYQELAKASTEIAQILITANIQKGDVVAVSGVRSFGLIASMLGVLMSGGVLLNININLPIIRQELMLSTAVVKTVLFISKETKNSFVGSLLTITINPDTGKASLNSSANTPVRVTLSPDDSAYIFFTSGTTGIPKGILGCHKGLSHFLHWQRSTFAITPQDRVAQLTGLSFDVVIRDIFLPLTSGATLCLPDADDDKLSAMRVLSWLESQQISLIHTVPTLILLWLMDVPKGISLRNLRLLFSAGEPLTDKLIKQWRSVFPESGQIVNLYGPTETTLAKCYYCVPVSLLPGVQPVGSPLPETQALVFTPNSQLSGIGEVGEIVLRTPFRTKGYINAKPEQLSKFAKNPFRDDDTDLLYYTGDRGRYRLDGTLDILGRIDQQVKIRGVRIELAEIEAVLNQHADVLNTVAIVREDIPGDKRLIAYIVPQPQAQLTQTKLRQFLKQNLPDYMIPSAFVFLEKFPLTVNGKTDRLALPAPDSTGQNTDEDFLAPRDELELQLTKIWEKVLKHKPIGVKDNFFNLGGHSLLGVKLFAQIEKSFQTNLPLSVLFQNPTVEEMAKVLRKEKVIPSWYSLVPIQSGGSRPILFGIHHIYFNDLSRYLGPEQPIYALHYAMAEATDRALSLPKMEDLAAHYIEEMRTLQPEGPYFLMGLSFGGVVAYEMAQQLVAQGQQVGLLALFDTNIEMGRKLLPFRQLVANLLRLPLPELMEKVNDLVERKLRVLRYGNQYQPYSYRPEALIETAKAYTPKAYSGRVNLFKAMDAFFIRYQNNPPEIGLRKFVNGQLEIYEVPGTHMGILEEPNVQVLAEKLRVCMDKALGDFEV